ncbi:hypothetical protein LAZ67_23001896 [Cordylochernes scorpioides]|uniref:Transposase n=1 Tax=Cordylochernes scorpioides TaxID=51811 RepID=A0ABY6LR03_9ARAC|nr:hypothetical protein LAZ67_23001896 [Cordylochernes scorpioides]
MPGHRKRRQFKQADAFTRGMVIGLKRAGWSIRQIAADTHLGASTVHRLWRRWLEQGNVAIYRNVGATRVTSARVDRRILRQAVAAPQATCTAILQHVQDTLDHSISTRTISRRLVANGLHSCRPLRRLPLTPPNRRQLLEWCRARSTWMTEWHRVVFSDESLIVAVYACGVDVEKGPIRQQLWNAPPCDNVESWFGGAIAYDSRSPLLRIQGTMTAQRYVDDVLRPVTLPYLQGVPNALYQQDNARPHTARISQQALQDVQMLPWPPYSPDLSPIEHVWDIIVRRLHALPQPRSEDELWQMVEREWRASPQDAIRTLIDSLPRRVAACIAVRDDLKWRAVGRMEAGQSQVEVAKWLNVNKSVKQFIETGTIKRKEGSGRKRKTATSEDRYLVVTAKCHREMTAIQLSNELSSATGTRISRQTVYRRLREGALYARRPMTHDQWANVLFSDKSRFSLNTDSRRVFIWREPGTRYHPSNIREIDSFRGGSLLVWAGISSSRRTPLHIFSGGTLTAQRYRDEILEPYLRPYRDQIGHNLIFMDDNARPNRARLVNEYLQSENIRRMDWPARSPDLNPIEHVWDALGRRIGARHPSPRTLVELRTALLEEWGLLPLDLLQSLVNSMRAHCETLIAVRGDHTPYLYLISLKSGTLTLGMLMRLLVILLVLALVTVAMFGSTEYLNLKLEMELTVTLSRENAHCNLRTNFNALPNALYSYVFLLTKTEDFC